MGVINFAFFKYILKFGADSHTLWYKLKGIEYISNLPIIFHYAFTLKLAMVYSICLLFTVIIHAFI